MGHPGNALAVRTTLAILIATCGLTGCGGDGSNPNDIITVGPDEAGMLRKVRSASELEGLLKGALHDASSSGGQVDEDLLLGLDLSDGEWSFMEPGDGVATLTDADLHNNSGVSNEDQTYSGRGQPPRGGDRSRRRFEF
ncbi:MAG: hypothetical protein ABI821_00380 [Pseudomonadota bacterium]